MMFQREYAASKILECTIIVYFFMKIIAAQNQKDYPYVQESWRSTGKNYVVKGRPRFDQASRLTGWHEISPKIGELKGIKKNRSNHPELWFNGGGLGDKSSEWNENRGRYLGSGRGSSFNVGTNFRSSNVQSSYWEPIFDGTIIAAIGSLFSKSIKDESNSERLERQKIRETLLLKKYTKILNDPVQLDILKRQSNNAPKYINQVVG